MTALVETAGGLAGRRLYLQGRTEVEIPAGALILVFKVGRKLYTNAPTFELCFEAPDGRELKDSGREGNDPPINLY